MEALSTLFERVKRAPQASVDLVCGYYRENMEWLNMQENYPKLIAYISLNYYSISDYWSRYLPDLCRINRHQDIITMDLSHFGTVYGESKINDNIACITRWEIKILKLQRLMRIGIASKSDCLQTDITKSKGKFYVTDLFGKRYDTTATYVVKSRTFLRVKTDDNIIIEVNTAKKNVTAYLKHSKQKTIISDNVKFDRKEYHLALTMWREDDAVQIINFQQILIE